MSLSPRRIAVGTLLLLAVAAAGTATAHAAAPVPQKIAEITNVGGVQSGPTAASTFTTTKPWHVVQLWTYHWNDAKGAVPGRVGLRDLKTGKLYGPWQTRGDNGQGGVPNANWTANVKVDLPAGRYRVTDSSPASWAQNAESGGRGFFYVLATPLAALAWPPLPSALVPIESVSNGCGGGVASSQPQFGDTSTYLNSNNPLGKRYPVSFREACNLHDAGYSGAKVLDTLNGGAPLDYFTWTQLRVDDKFYADMQLLCIDQIPATAPVARADCLAKGGKTSWGAQTRYNFVRTAGSLFVRARPSLGGTWTQGDGADRISITISQSLRHVGATWQIGDGERIQKGEFRGTLISQDQDSIVRGTARLENAAKTMQRPMTITVDPDRPKEIILSGGGLAGTFTR